MSTIDLIHKALIVDGALEAHLRLAPVADRLNEIAIHRAIPADVPEPGKDQPRKSGPSHNYEQSVGFKADDAAAPQQLRHAQPAQQREDLPRVEQGADRIVVIPER